MKLKGFSIIEFMIAISLGAMLIGGVISVYLSNKTTFNIQQGLARIQENGRFINHILTQDLRMAGFQGCTSLSSTNIVNLVPNKPYTTLLDIPVYGYEAQQDTWSPTLPANITGKVKPGTDVIEIRKAANLGVQLKAPMTRPNTAILIENRYGIQAGDTVLITDCTTGNLFIAGANSNASAITHTVANNTSNDLAKAYQQDAQIMKFEYFIYYIKDTGRTNNRNNIVYGLFRQDDKGNEIEIASGVENMQVLYGVDTNGDKNADSFMSATTVTAGNNWNNVITIQITSLLNSIDDIELTNKSYYFNGEVLTSTDRRTKKEWNSFVKIRNRGL